MSLIDTFGWSGRRDAPAHALSGLGRTCKVVRTREALEALTPAWLELEGRCAGPNLFQSLGWARAIFDFEAARGNTAFDPVIVTLREGPRLVALLPLERIHTGMRRVLAPLGHAFGQYADLLMAPDLEARGTVARMLQSAIKAAPCDVVSFHKVRKGSPLALGMPDTAIETGTVEGAPYVALDVYADFAGYFSTIRTKTRKNMRNARNRLAREGVVAHSVVTGPGEQLALIERTVAGRAGRLREQGLTSRAFRDAGFADFCKKLVGRGDLELLAFSLTHGGRPIAEQWGFVHGGRYYAFVASRDFSNSDESPGKLHLGEITRACFERGLAGCDLGVPAMPYKLTWATDTVAVRDHALPVTPRGWLLIQLWDVFARPRVKAGLLRIPARWRAGIMRLAGHGH